MGNTFSSLRNNRKSLLNKLAEEAKKESQKAGADDRFWKLTVDQKTKIGYAEIRFLPAPQGEDIPWVRVWSHGFQVNGAWYIENCPTTLGSNRLCPVCKDNNKLWNSGIESDKDIARNRKRKLSFISNILVVNDPAHPENNGKVFLYRYGKKIQDKIMELIEPQFPDQTPANPFDMWEGCNFKLKSAHVGGFQNYDKSSFDGPSEIPGDDKAKEALWKQARPLSEFIAEDQFKPYAELETRFQKVLTGTADTARTAEDAVKKSTPTVDDATETAAEIQKEEKKQRTRKAAAKPAPVDDEVPPEDVDDIKKFFGDVDDDN